MSNKRVCIIDRNSEMIMKVSREFARAAINTRPDLYSYTSKSNLKKFLKRDLKLTKNAKYIERLANDKRMKGIAGVANRVKVGVKISKEKQARVKEFKQFYILPWGTLLIRQYISNRNNKIKAETA